MLQNAFQNRFPGFSRNSYPGGSCRLCDAQSVLKNNCISLKTFGTNVTNRTKSDMGLIKGGIRFSLHLDIQIQAYTNNHDDHAVDSSDDDFDELVLKEID